MVNKSTLLTTVRASFLQLKHWETGYQNSGTLWLESKLFEKQINHYPLEQFVGPLTSGKGWRMVELLPKVFWFQFKHNVPDIWYSDAVFQIIHCSYVITGQVMLERSINLACWPLEKLDGEWLNCCQKFFISNYNNFFIFCCSIHCSYILSGQFMLKWSANFAFLPLEQYFRPQ